MGLQGSVMFMLDPAFVATSTALCSLSLCEARLQNDARFAWIVLVPRRDGLVELEELGSAERAELAEEIVAAGAAVRAVGAALGRPVDKLNVGQLGNVTRQLHLHVVGRRRDDPCWPGPVWGCGEAAPFAPDALALAQRVGVAALAEVG